MLEYDIVRMIGIPSFFLNVLPDTKFSLLPRDIITTIVAFALEWRINDDNKIHRKIEDVRMDDFKYLLHTTFLGKPYGVYHINTASEDILQLVHNDSVIMSLGTSCHGGYRFVSGNYREFKIDYCNDTTCELLEKSCIHYVSRFAEGYWTIGSSTETDDGNIWREVARYSSTVIRIESSYLSGSTVTACCNMYNHDGLVARVEREEDFDIRWHFRRGKVVFSLHQWGEHIIGTTYDNGKIIKQVSRWTARNESPGQCARDIVQLLGVKLITLKSIVEEMRAETSR